jgi:uncharacterized damage-inducible protein DinB
VSASLLDDAFAHHIWATEQLFEACGSLSEDQLRSPCPGTYGSIADTLKHLVSADAWYLSFFRDEGVARVDDDDPSMTIADARAALARNGPVWMEVLAGGPDPDRIILEIDGEWEVASPVGVRLAQVVHHGTDHRSQVCTALTGLGVEPPEIDVWAWARATGRERATDRTAGT